MSIQPREFRNALGRFATGITVVTMLDGSGHDGPRVHDITVNAFMSVSLEPPLVAVSIDKKARSHAILAGSDRYGISVLAEAQVDHSDSFARRKDPGLEVKYAYLGDFPVIEGACAQMVCRIVDAHEAGDHTLYIGQVEHLAYCDERPLLFFGGRYSALQELRVLEEVAG